MDNPAIAVLIVFIVIGIPIICVTLIVLAKILKGSNSSGSSASGHADDLKILTELNRNLSRMEERIEALETIIIERQKSKNS